jgi:hypothetical protein
MSPMRKAIFSLAILLLMFEGSNADEGKSKSSSVKSVQYYKNHWDEAEKKVDLCKGNFMDKECVNAYEARYSAYANETKKKYEECLKVRSENEECLKAYNANALLFAVEARENAKKRPKDEFGF